MSTLAPHRLEKCQTPLTQLSRVLDATFPQLLTHWQQVTHMLDLAADCRVFREEISNHGQIFIKIFAQVGDNPPVSEEIIFFTSPSIGYGLKTNELQPIIIGWFSDDPDLEAVVIQIFNWLLFRRLIADNLNGIGDLSVLTAECQPMAPAPILVEGEYSLRQIPELIQQRIEITYIKAALQHSQWNRRQAAGLLKISYRGLLYKIKEHGLTPVNCRQNIGLAQPVHWQSFSLKRQCRAEIAKEEKVVIAKVLAKTHWNRSRACEILGISYRSLLNKIEDYGLSKLAL